MSQNMSPERLQEITEKANKDLVIEFAAFLEMKREIERCWKDHELYKLKAENFVSMLREENERLKRERDNIKNELDKYLSRANVFADRIKMLTDERDRMTNQLESAKEKTEEEKVTRSLPVRSKAVKKTFLKKFADPNAI